MAVEAASAVEAAEADSEGEAVVEAEAASEEVVEAEAVEEEAEAAEAASEAPGRSLSLSSSKECF